MERARRRPARRAPRPRERRRSARPDPASGAGGPELREPEVRALRARAARSRRSARARPRRATARARAVDLADAHRGAALERAPSRRRATPCARAARPAARAGRRASETTACATSIPFPGTFRGIQTARSPWPSIADRVGRERRLRGGRRGRRRRGARRLGNGDAARAEDVQAALRLLRDLLRRVAGQRGEQVGARRPASGGAAERGGERRRAGVATSSGFARASPSRSREARPASSRGTPATAAISWLSTFGSRSSASSQSTSTVVIAAQSSGRYGRDPPNDGRAAPRIPLARPRAPVAARACHAP